MQLYSTSYAVRSAFLAVATLLAGLTGIAYLLGIAGEAMRLGDGKSLAIAIRQFSCRPNALQVAQPASKQ